MRIQQLTFALCLVLSFAPKSSAASPEAKCNGNTTPLYSNQNLELSICHDDSVHIEISQLGQWQDCVDSMLLVTERKSKKTYQIADCPSMEAKQFMISKENLLLRHSYAEYPDFSEHPLMVESTNLVTLTKQYSLLRKFPVCKKSEIAQAIRKIESTKAKPFDGNTFFSAIYGSFYKLRDCANSFPAEVLSTLTEYEKKQAFDGEAAETLGAVIREVELIAKSKRQNQ